MYLKIFKPGYFWNKKFYNYLYFYMHICCKKNIWLISEKYLYNFYKV